MMNLISRIHLATLIAAILIITWASDLTAGEPRPNIVLIMADDMS
ncbi:MAG: hypothetical protein ACKVH8_21115 [Pirellulales bacterium]